MRYVKIYLHNINTILYIYINTIINTIAINTDFINFGGINIWKMKK